LGIGSGCVCTHDVGGASLNRKLTSCVPVPPPAAYVNVTRPPGVMLTVLSSGSDPSWK
jgi:hypothetical protein